MTVEIARDVLSDELKRIEAALDSVGGSAFEDSVAFIKRMHHALEASVSTQRHYADLLNAYDGGKRMLFANATEWMERLATLSREKDT